MSARDPNVPGGGPPADDDLDDAFDDDFASFAAALRGELATVVTAPDRAAAIRARAHAELRRASAPPPTRSRAHHLFLVEASTALAAGAMYVVWTIRQLWPR